MQLIAAAKAAALLQIQRPVSLLVRHGIRLILSFSYANIAFAF